MQTTEEPIITVDGLRFKKYQMECMEILAKAEKYTSVKEWMQDNLLSSVVSNLAVIEHNYAKPILERLREEGFPS